MPPCGRSKLVPLRLWGTARAAHWGHLRSWVFLAFGKCNAKHFCFTFNHQDKSPLLAGGDTSQEQSVSNIHSGATQINPQMIPLLAVSPRTKRCSVFKSIPINVNPLPWEFVSIKWFTSILLRYVLCIHLVLIHLSYVKKMGAWSPTFQFDRLGSIHFTTKAWIVFN